MSVIGLNLWINFQVLKSTFEQVQFFVANKLREINKQMSNFQVEIVQKLIKQINDRDKIISSLSAKQEIQGTLQSSKAESSIGKLDGSLEERYQQLLLQNKQYEDELQSLIGQLKCIKVYIQELKNAKSLREQSSNASPAKKLQIQQQQSQILSKISSLSRFQSISIDSRLETIKEEQSEKSVKSYESKQSEQKEESFLPYPSFHNKIQSRLAQSTSFECTSEIIDIKNTLFDNNSQQNSQKVNPSEETIQHSLCVLKNYQNFTNLIQSGSFEHKKLPFQSLKLLSMPNLRVQSVINQRHLVFQNGYIYTGSTIRFNQIEVKPMGFGQLYCHGNLLYCGEWKNGRFDGWGKMFFDTQSKIKNFNGKWEKGTPFGPCSIKFWKNQKFIGTMKNGVIEGEGSYYWNNQLVWRGVWENNQLRKNQI